MEESCKLTFTKFHTTDLDQIWMKCKPLLSLNVNVSDTADKLATDYLGMLIGYRLLKVLTFLAGAAQ